MSTGSLSKLKIFVSIYFKCAEECSCHCVHVEWLITVILNMNLFLRQIKLKCTYLLLEFKPVVLYWKGRNLWVRVRHSFDCSLLRISAGVLPVLFLASESFPCAQLVSKSESALGSARNKALKGHCVCCRGASFWCQRDDTSLPDGELHHHHQGRHACKVSTTVTFAWLVLWLRQLVG